MLSLFRMTEKGVEFKGGSLHDGLGGFYGFGGSGEHLALLLLVLQNTVPRDDRDALTVSAVSAVVAVSVVTATPLELNPPFRNPDLCARYKPLLRTECTEIV